MRRRSGAAVAVVVAFSTMLCVLLLLGLTLVGAVVAAADVAVATDDVAAATGPLAARPKPKMGVAGDWVPYTVAATAGDTADAITVNGTSTGRWNDAAAHVVDDTTETFGVYITFLGDRGEGVVAPPPKPTKGGGTPAKPVITDALLVYATLNEADFTDVLDPFLPRRPSNTGVGGDGAARGDDYQLHVGDVPAFVEVDFRCHKSGVGDVVVYIHTLRRRLVGAVFVETSSTTTFVFQKTCEVTKPDKHLGVALLGLAAKGQWAWNVPGNVVTHGVVSDMFDMNTNENFVVAEANDDDDLFLLWVDQNTADTTFVVKSLTYNEEFLTANVTYPTSRVVKPRSKLRPEASVNVHYHCRSKRRKGVSQMTMTIEVGGDVTGSIAHDNPTATATTTAAAAPMKMTAVHDAVVAAAGADARDVTVTVTPPTHTMAQKQPVSLVTVTWLKDCYVEEEVIIFWRSGVAFFFLIVLVMMIAFISVMCWARSSHSDQAYTFRDGWRECCSDGACGCCPVACAGIFARPASSFHRGLADEERGNGGGGGDGGDGGDGGSSDRSSGRGHGGKQQQQLQRHQQQRRDRDEHKHGDGNNAVAADSGRKSKHKSSFTDMVDDDDDNRRSDVDDDIARDFEAVNLEMGAMKSGGSGDVGYGAL